MKFEIETLVEGVRVTGNGCDYLFKTKLFSHSSILLDENSKTIVSMPRSSWWRMNFNVFVEGKKYQLHQRALGTELIFGALNKRFYTISGLDFHAIDSHNKTTCVTKVSSDEALLKKHIIEISDKDHWLALLAATCLELSLVTESG